MILATIVFAFLLRVISLNQSFWLDEATSGLVVRNFNLGEIVTKFSPGDFHPPLYYLILKIWSYVFGTSEIALRFPSIVFGILTIYLIYKIALLITVHRSQFTAKLAALLLATSGLHIYYSQEARMYSLVTLLVTFLVYLFIKKNWLIFSIVLMLVGLTDYPALLIIPIFWLVGRKEWRKLVISFSLLVISYLIWLPILLKQLSVGFSTAGSNWGNLLGTFSLKNFALIPVKFILGRISFDNKWLYGAIVVMVIWLYGYLLSKAVKKSLLFWLWLILPISLGAIISIKLSIFSYFRFLFCLPAFYLLVALGLESFSKNWRKIALVLVLFVNLIASIIYLTNSRFQRENWRGLVNFVEAQKPAKSITLFAADSNMEAYKYYDSDANISGPNGFSTKYKEIWLMRYLQSVFDSKDLLRAKIEASGYNKEKEYDFNGVVVWKYNK